MGGRGAKATKIGISEKSRRILENHRKNGVKILNTAPKGWTAIEGALTAPRGYTWYSNNKSLFKGERKTALVKDKE